ncbi:MAG: hypothetical protein JO081_10920 [Alphaproteobacteria bacterium]|nr:hypothetical protein [Alphaproteobacteria bacterium]
MRKLILGGLTALLLGTAALIPQAEARCWWNGYSWHCWHPHAWWWHRQYYHPYAWNWRHHPYYVYRY